MLNFLRKCHMFANNARIAHNSLILRALQTTPTAYQTTLASPFIYISEDGKKWPLKRFKHFSLSQL